MPDIRSDDKAVHRPGTSTRQSGLTLSLLVVFFSWGCSPSAGRYLERDPQSSRELRGAKAVGASAQSTTESQGSRLPQTGQRRALVIGIAGYKHASRLNSPILDAKAVARELKRIGFKLTEVYDADQLGLESAIGKFMESVSRGDEVLVYYSGHGVQIDGVNYLLPRDFNAKLRSQVKSKAIEVGMLLDELVERQSAVRVVILDACRNNPFSKAKGYKSGLAPIDARLGGTFLAYATAPGSTASDGDPGENSIFTKVLLEYIGQAGLEIEQMLKQVRMRVQVETGGEQIPWTSSAIGNYYIVQAAPPASGSEQPSVGRRLRTEESGSKPDSPSTRGAGAEVSGQSGKVEVAVGRSNNHSPFYEGVSPSDGFTVRLPAPLAEAGRGLRPTRRTTNTSDGEVVSADWYSTVDGNAYSVLAIEYPEKTVSSVRPEVFVSDSIAGTAKAVGGTVKSERSIKYGEYFGKEFTVSISHGEVRGRVYLVGRRAYLLNAICSNRNTPPSVVDEFFNSFRLVDSSAQWSPTQAP